MGEGTATVVIEARSLMREALVSLMESHSYHVICSVGSTADIDRSVLKEEQPELVILGALPTDRVAEATSSIRRCWQDAKIIMLFENASSKDLQKLLASGLDACIPMFASPRTLMDTLQLIVCEHLRVLMLSDSAIPLALIDPEEDEDDEPLQAANLAVAGPASSFQVSASAVPCARGLLANGAGDGAARVAGGHGLSEREEQILKALVRGYSNKMIARMYSVTEATVKVHMKSILRKIRVANRTQAAIWALKNAYFSEGIDEEGPRTPKAIPAVQSLNGHGD
jgi:two-component system nitrate/nitrite response regulator NarL